MANSTSSHNGRTIGLRLLLCGVLLLLTFAATPQSANKAASEILRKAGTTGGLIVHVGCGDGKLTAAFGAHDGFVVDGLANSKDNLRRARDCIRARGLYGKIAVRQWNGPRLPYIPNIVNLLVVENGVTVSDRELTRVLAPAGVAYIESAEGVKTVTKPRPDAIDDWTHFLHDATNNAVGDDRLVDMPFHAQWMDGPKWARHHNHLSSTSAAVSAGGRLFTIADEGPICSMAQPSQWRLIARDAFNGVRIWEKPIGPWEGRLRVFRSGPPDLQRRIVATERRVYVTDGYGKPVTALDAATGELLDTYEKTAGAVEIIHHNGILYIVTGTIAPEKYARQRRRGRPSPPAHNKGILAIRADTGELLWMKYDANTTEVLPATLCTNRGRLFFQNLRHIVCMDADSGQELWRVQRPSRTRRRSWSSATLVAYKDLLFSADCPPVKKNDTDTDVGVEVSWKVTAHPPRGKYGQGELIALKADSGDELWRCATALGYCTPPDVLVADGLVWTGYDSGRNKPDFTEGRDPYTGEVRRRIQTASAFNVAHHHRCFRDKATNRYIVLGRTGVELLDLTGQIKPLRHCWTRGACQYGVMPANGMLYMPPHSCACYIQSKLSGFWALAPKRPSAISDVQQPQLQPKPEAETTGDAPASSPEDWPTFRHDAARSGRASTTVPINLQQAWKATVGGQLTSPVVAAGLLLVASKQNHTIHAFDAQTGDALWQFIAGGRIDSPPTIHDGLAIFGCADGYVYCLRLADGELIWRFRAAPDDRNTVIRGQIESLWPVTGSVLVHDDCVYCTAGRSSYLDGGMYMYKLDPESGRKLDSRRFYRRDPGTGRQPEKLVEDVELPGALPDVLVCDGEYIYLRDKRLGFDLNEHEPTVRHLYCSAGLLDDTWWHRTYWMWARRDWGRASGWHVAARNRPSGRILVCDYDTVFGYGRKRVRGFTSLRGYHLFRADKKVKFLDKKLRNNNRALMEHFKPAKVNYHWSSKVALIVRAMVLSDDALFLAGPPQRQNNGGEPKLGGNGPGRLIVASADDGAERARYQLPAQPAFDGLAAAQSRLYIADTAGNIVCMSEQ